MNRLAYDILLSYWHLIMLNLYNIIYLNHFLLQKDSFI